MDLFHIGIYSCNFAGHELRQPCVGRDPVWPRRLRLRQRRLRLRFLRVKFINLDRRIRVGTIILGMSTRLVRSITAATVARIPTGEKSPLTGSSLSVWQVSSPGVVYYGHADYSYGINKI